MKRKFTFLIAAALMLLTMVATTGRMWGQTTYALTIQTSDFNTTSYTANNGNHTKDAVDVNNANNTMSVTWVSNQVMQPSSVMQWQKNNGYIYNTTDLGTINSVTVNSTAGTFTTYYGTEAHPTSGTTVGNGFFTTQVGNATGKTTSIVINFTVGGGSAPYITASNVNLTYDATESSIAYTVDNPVEGGTMSSMPTTGGDWLTVSGPNNGIVPLSCSANPSALERTAIVRLTYTYEAKETVTKDVTVTQAGNPNVFDNISDITEVGTAYRVKGTVVAINSKGFIMGDGTGYVYTYLNDTPSVEVGDMIKVSGTTGSYGHIIQFTSSATIEEATESNYDGTPDVTEITEVPDYSEGYYLATYLQFEGELTTSNNNYFVAVGEGQIRITYPTNDQTTELNPLLNKTVRVHGFFSGISGSGNNAVFTTTMESVEEVTNPIISIDPETANQFTYVFGAGPSAEQVFEVTGTNLTSDDIVATITTGAEYFEITDDAVYSNTVTVNSGDVISIRMKAGLALNNDYAGVLTLTNEGAENIVVNLTGSVTSATYAINLDDDITGGTIESDKASAAEGEIVTLTAHPNAAYIFDSWSVLKDDLVTPVTVTDNQFTMPACEVYVTATFNAKQTFAVTCAYDDTKGLLTATPTPAYEGQTVTLEYTAETGYTLSSIVITKTSDGSATGITPTASGDDFTFEMPGYAVTATATFEELSEVTYDFSQISGFNEWTTSYTQHVVNYTEATVTFASANRSTQTITDVPVTKGGDVMIVMKNGQPNISGATFVCQQWGTKAQTITLHYSTDGGESYTSTEITSTNFTITCAALPAGTNAVKITFSTSSNQVGIASATLNFSSDPTISVAPTSLTGFTYAEGQGPSEPQNIVVAGNNLGNNITVALPLNSNFEMKLGEGEWTNSLTLQRNNGAVASTTINVRMKSGLTENNYNGTITVTSGTLEETVSLSGTVNPAPVTTTYNRVTSVTDGKHYIIVAESAEEYYALGNQNNGNYRNPVSITATSESTTISSDSGVSEIVINGNSTNGYTLHADGFLVGGNKSLKNTGNASSTWAITFDGSNHAVIKHGSTDYSIQFNSDRFNCYSSSQTPVYLYEKENDTDLEFFGNNTYTDLTIPATETLTVTEGSVLTVTGDFINQGTAANLVIEDGGQVIVNNTGVQATFKKSVSHGAAKTAANWYTISSPVNNIAPGSVTNLIQATPANYDLYYYDEATTTWFNHKAAGHAVANMTNGKGYLYWNNTGAELSFPGELNSGSVVIAVTKTGTGDLAGFNLIGNPYSHNIYKGDGTAIPNSILSAGYYTLSNAGAWTAGTDNTTAIKPGQGILVKATAAGTVTMTNTTANGAKRNNEFIKFMIANSQYEDVAYALFNDEEGLNKINHRNANIPMLYIPQDGQNYAIATMSDETQSFNLNLRAMTTGQYTLSFKAEGKYDYLHVIDRMTGEDIDMLLDGEYSFIASPSDNDARFIVKLGYNTNNSAGNDIFAFQNGSDIIVNGEGELQVFDVTGRMVATQHVNGVQTVNVPSQGVFIFKLNEKTQKIVVR